MLRDDIFLLELFGHNFDQAFDCFHHQTDFKRVGNSGPDELSIGFGWGVHVDLDLADALGLHVARSVDDGIERVVVAIKSSVITDGSVDSAGDVGGRGVMLP